MESSSPSLTFNVRKRQPELVTPAIPTPHEIKLLSDIDDQEFLRFHLPVIRIYRKKSSMAKKDPVEVIKQALAQTLVFYYPFAGRLREGPGRKLMVDCTAEGVLFIEADADVTLDQFDADSLQPPFQYSHKVLCDVPGSNDFISCPLLLIQVTRLKCGGFILATSCNHTLSDGVGLSQFMKGMTEMAQGERKPSIVPVWRREVLMARDPPRITCNHREYDQVPTTNQDTIPSFDSMVYRSFFFGHSEIASLRRLVPHHLQKCTAFVFITACYWRCRTKALQIESEKDVRIMYAVNARPRFNPPLPTGYYGNVVALPSAVTTAGELCKNPLGYGVELMNRVKREVTEEYMHSVADLMVIKGRCMLTNVRSCFVSDQSHVGLRDIDFGWGKAVSGAPTICGSFFSPPNPGATFLTPHKNAKGEEGSALPVWLPAEAMNRFVEELDCMLRNQNQPTEENAPATFIKSTLLTNLQLMKRIKIWSYIF